MVGGWGGLGAVGSWEGWVLTQVKGTRTSCSSGHHLWL